MQIGCLQFVTMSLELLLLYLPLSLFCYMTIYSWEPKRT